MDEILMLFLKIFAGFAGVGVGVAFCMVIIVGIVKLLNLRNY